MVENNNINKQAPDITENSDVNFQRTAVCFKIPAMPNEYVKKELNKSKDRLWNNKVFHEYCTKNQLTKEQLLEHVLNKVFYAPEGSPLTVYLVNLSIPKQDGKNPKVIGIRPQLLEISPLFEMLADMLGPGKSLRFVGVPQGKTFSISKIQIVQDDLQLPYEASAVILPYKDQNRVGANFFYEMYEKTHSYVEYTAKKFQEWEDYLNWKQKLAERGLVGCRYFSIEQREDNKDRDKDRPELNIGLIFDSKNNFDSIRRDLRNGMQLFELDYSQDPWRFVYQTNFKRQIHSWKLGYFHGVKSEGYSENLPREMNAEVRKDCPFSHPYIVWVCYEVSEDDLEAMGNSNLKPEEFVNQEIIPLFPSDGFLALSAVQDFTLIRRFRNAIQDFKNGVCDSPNLPLWLFDATRARLPHQKDFREITEWLDPQIAKNQSQREAVKKMLAAPDLCLVQGPPGTGKTTVIAEAIYQIAKQGKRVLLASQSNDAVDNALERLQKDPAIRAVRMKNNARTISEGGLKYTESNILSEFYHTLAIKTKEKWLGLWQTRDEEIRTCKKDYRDAMNYEEDLSSLSSKVKQEADALHQNEMALQKTRAQIERVKDENKSLIQARRQFDILLHDYEDHQNDDFCLLSQGLLQAMRPLAQQLTNMFHTQGLIPDLPDFDEHDTEKVSSGKLVNLLFYCQQLPSLLAKTQDEAESGTVDSLALNKIEMQLEENDRQMDELPDDDNEGFKRLRKENKELKKQREKLLSKSGSLSDRFTDVEQKMFSDSLLRIMSGSEGGKHLKEAIQRCKNAADETWPLIIEAGKAWIKAHPEQEFSKLSEAAEDANNKSEKLRDRLISLQQQQNEKEQALSTMRDRYGAQDESQASVARSIKSRQEQLENRGRDDEIRPVWESILNEYCERLIQNDSGTEDNEIYLKTYLDACNVVGTSCTANMREFEKHGFEDFDVAIIDEVSKATPPELLLPLMKARKAILVGDHRQLPPMFGESETSYEALMNRESEADKFDEEDIEGNAAQAKLLTRENFEKFRNMVTASLFKEYFETADDSIKQRLQIQFRMHSEIMQVINRFYENQLRSGLTQEQEAKQRDHGLTLFDLHKRPFLTPEHHVYWIDSSCLPNGDPIYESRRGASTSACNLLEQQIILQLVKLMAQTCNENKISKTLGIISFYQAQINDLRKAIKKMESNKTLDLSNLELKYSDINTVDRFQGKEKNIVIVSMVRNKKSHRLGEHTLEFERINVAFSRAQQLLVIVGAQKLFADQEITMPAMDTKGTKTANVYGNILEYVRNIGTSLDASCVLTENDCASIRNDTHALAAERKAWEGRRK